MHGSIALEQPLPFIACGGIFPAGRVLFQPPEEAEPLGGRSGVEEKLLDGFDAASGIPDGYPLGVRYTCGRRDQVSRRVCGQTYRTMAHGARRMLRWMRLRLPAP